MVGARDPEQLVLAAERLMVAPADLLRAISTNEITLTEAGGTETVMTTLLSVGAAEQALRIGRRSVRFA